MCWAQRSGGPGPCLCVRAFSTPLLLSPSEEWRTERGVARAGRVGGACQHEESPKEWLCRGKFGRANLKLWLESLGCVEGILGQQTACWIVGLPSPSLLIASGPQSMTYNLSLLEGQRPLLLRMALHPGCLPEGAPGFEIFLSTLALYPVPHAQGMGSPSSHPVLKPESVLWSTLDLKVPDSR